MICTQWPCYVNTKSRIYILAILYKVHTNYPYLRSGYAWCVYYYLKQFQMVRWICYYMRYLLSTSKIWNHESEDTVTSYGQNENESCIFFVTVTKRDAFEDTVFGCKNSLQWYSILKELSYFKICVIFLKVLTYSRSFIKLVNWSGKRTREWNVADNV